MKTFDPLLQTHIDGVLTSLGTGWKIVRKDGEIARVNTVGEDATADFGFPAPFDEGIQTYLAQEAVNRTNFQNDESMNVDNAEIAGIFDGVQFNEQDLRRGLFNSADVFVFTYNHQDLTMPAGRMFRGKFGTAKVSDKGFFFIELRSLIEVFRRRLNENYTKDCRSDLGDPDRCRIPIQANTVLRDTDYALGDFIKVLNPIPLTVLNPGAESGVASWTNETGVLDATDAQVTPNTGTAYFAGGNAEAETKAFQDVAIPVGQQVEVDASNRKARITWYQQSINEAADDTAEMTVRFFDVSVVQIGAESSAGLTANVGGWVQRQLEVDIPPLTRTIRIAQHMFRNTAPDNDAFIDDITLDLFPITPIQEDFGLLIYKCTVAGTTASIQPAYDPDVGDTTTDGTADFITEDAWMRTFIVTAVDPTDPRRKFTVTELTPNSGGTTAGRNFFPDDSMNGGGAFFETGANAGRGMEVRDFIADDGITITQDIELFRDVARNIEVGDKGRIFRGCDKTQTICVTIFENAINTIAEWYPPGPDFAGKFPDAQ